MWPAAHHYSDKNGGAATLPPPLRTVMENEPETGNKAGAESCLIRPCPSSEGVELVDNFLG